ncbi:styrene-oxide isomerase StyC [Panacagrimonas sp.]|uniref:styrene-oxide isomerase StyC n=1 Tax=Panacagrimonas sp. TaxID=2480088 RepID=UPI003B5298BB
MKTQQRRMVAHGAIIILIALASGFGLVMSLIGGFEIFPGTILQFDIPGDPRAWARAHVGGILNGLLVIAGALVTLAMALPQPIASRLHWMLVGTGYANTVFYWGALFAPSRALTFGDNRLGETNLAGILGFAPALVFAFVTMIAMVILIRHGFSESESA